MWAFVGGLIELVAMPQTIFFTGPVSLDIELSLGPVGMIFCMMSAVRLAQGRSARLHSTA